MLTKSKELQQGAHFKTVSMTGIQRDALKVKNADHPFTDKNSAMREETVTEDATPNLSLRQQN
jgi:hypothetical protein